MTDQDRTRAIAGVPPVVAAPRDLSAPAPTPTVSSADASWSRPAGSASPGSVPAPDPLAERPEALVGAAFAGGFVLAMILKRLGR